MKIILTNDDGYGALGLETIKKMLEQLGQVYVFAPSSPQSGMSCGFTTYRKPINVQKIDERNFKVDGTPVDCVLFANAYLQGDYDMIVSGCNNGYNLCNDIMYSGTCGACEQGLVFKKKCVAFSAEHFTDDRHLKEYLPKALSFILDNGLLSGDYYLNVNLNNPDAQYKGARITELFMRYLSKYALIPAENGSYVVKHIHDEDVFDNDDYDISATTNGYISVTPISPNNYKWEIYDELKRKIKL